MPGAWPDFAAAVPPKMPVFAHAKVVDGGVLAHGVAFIWRQARILHALEHPAARVPRFFIPSFAHVMPAAKRDKRRMPVAS